MMSTNTEKNSALSEEGHVLTAYVFFLVVSLASMQINSFWNPFSKIKLQTLNSRIMSFSQWCSSHSTSGDAVFWFFVPFFFSFWLFFFILTAEPWTCWSCTWINIIYFKLLGKLRPKREREKKRYTKKQKTASPGVEPGLSARASNFSTTAPQWHTWFEKLILSYQNNLSLP